MNHVSRAVLDVACGTGGKVDLLLRGLEDQVITTRVATDDEGNYMALDIPDCTFTGADVLEARHCGVGFKLRARTRP